jgi:excisionase family DNA binding protein
VAATVLQGCRVREIKLAARKYNLGRVVTVKELAAYLRVHPSTIYKLLRLGELPGFRVASEWRFNLATIDRWLLERNVKPREDESMRGAELGPPRGTPRNA